MSRRLVAALACRAAGTRLYGKPFQILDLDSSTTILDHLLHGVDHSNVIDGAVIGISEGLENLPFLDVASRHGSAYVLGHPTDVLWRLIQCARAGAATDVFRVTTESPFPAWELLDDCWRKHVENDNDITVCDWLPEGCHFEIYRSEALERAHAEALPEERSEYCSAYPRRRPDRFRIEVVRPPEALCRLDLRLTVDYPEDLVVCRRVMEALRDLGPHIPVSRIIEFLDSRPWLKELLEPYVVAEPLWAHVAK